MSYGLDFEDKLMLTDHRGNDQGSLSVVLTPCTKKGSPLGDDYFVEDPKELLDKGICLILTAGPFHCPVIRTLFAPVRGPIIVQK